jgi:hypothetical protein
MRITRRPREVEKRRQNARSRSANDEPPSSRVTKVRRSLCYVEPMATVARILETDELGGERCVACGAPGEIHVELRTPEGVAEPRPERDLRARLCRSCAQAQDDASRIGSRLVYAIVAMAPVAGLATGLVAGHRDGIAVTVAVLSGLVAARLMIASIKRARARKTRVLLLEAEGDRVVLQLSIPDAADAPVGGYRAAAREGIAGDEPVTPLPPRTAFGLAWYGGLLVCIAVLGAAWNGAFARAGTLVIDSPRDAVRVSIDGDTIELAAGGNATRTLRAGVHGYRVEYLATGHEVHGSFDVPVGRGTLLTTDPAQCYRIWTSSPKTKTAVNENETVRWANLLDVKMAARIECNER